jgi:hypothetical protein
METLQCRAGDRLRQTVNERLNGVSGYDSLQIILGEAGVDFSAEEKARLAERKNRYYKELTGTVTPSDLLPGMAELFSTFPSWRWAPSTTRCGRWCAGSASKS